MLSPRSLFPSFFMVPPRIPRNEVRQPGPADNPRNAPPEGALKKWGRRLFYATGIAAVLALAGGAAYAGMSPETQKSITNSLQKGLKSAGERMRVASEQGQRFMNYVLRRPTAVPPKPIAQNPFRQFPPNPNNPFEPMGYETMPVPPFKPTDNLNPWDPNPTVPVPSNN